MGFSTMKDYDLKVMSQDLEYLHEEWRDEIDDASLRRNSLVLRRLLVEQDLTKAWRKVGFEDEPKIKAPTIEEHLKTCPLQDVLFATAGGASYRGTQIATLFMPRGAANPEETRRRSALGPFVFKLHGFKEFIESPCMIVKGTAVSRKDLIEYVANKLGGAHTDQRRGAAKPLDVIFTCLDEISQTTQVAGKNAIYYELLSIGQNMIRSDDINRLIQRLGELLGDNAQSTDTRHDCAIQQKEFTRPLNHHLLGIERFAVGLLCCKKCFPMEGGSGSRA